MTIKKTVIVLLIGVPLLFISCGKSQDILFCEGIDRNGEGKHCGTKFETGDLTAVFRSGKPFETDKVTVKVFEIDAGKEKPYDSIDVTVKPGDRSGNLTVRLYNSGRYHLKVFLNEELIAQGDVEMVDL